MYSFRAAVKSDFKAIAMLHAKSWQENYRGAFSDHFLDNEVVDDRLKVWKNRLEKPEDHQFVHVVEVEHALAAFICGYIDDHREYGTLIDNLHVHSKYIGQGIGERLMIDAAKRLKEKDSVSMYLWVLASNAKAIRFYERIGGKCIETVNDYDIGDREITKTRYHWPNLKVTQNLNHP